MKVIQGKQAVMRPYLTEEQYVRPVREHAVKDAEIRKPELNEPAVEAAVMKEPCAAPLNTVIVTAGTDRVLNAAEEENLTIGEIFAYIK